MPHRPPLNPGEGTGGNLLDQIAAEAGVTPGALVGRPEVVDPLSDLAQIARLKQPEVTSENLVEEAVENFPFDEMIDLVQSKSGSTWWTIKDEIIDYATEASERLGPALNAKALETWWNMGLREFTKSLPKSTPTACTTIDLIGPLFTNLLNTCVTNADHILLDVLDEHIPNSLGWRLPTGTLEIYGNVGDDFASEAHGSAHIALHGNAQNLVGLGAYEDCVIKIEGNVGDFAATQAHDQARVLISGQVGSGYGQAMYGEAILEVGSARSSTVGKVSPVFNGKITVAGKEINPPLMRIP